MRERTYSTKTSEQYALYVVGYDCGIKDMEVIEVVAADSYEKALAYAEKSGEELYEDLNLAPTPDEFDGTEEEFEQIKAECSLNAIGFWCREFNEDDNEDLRLLSDRGVLEI